MKNDQGTSKDHADATGRFADRIVKVEKARVGDFLPNDYNPRVHDEDQKEMMVKELTHHGKVDTLKVFQDADGRWRFFDGHMRGSLDPDEVWWIAYTDLSPAEAREASTTFDFIGERALVDMDNLGRILLEMEDPDQDTLENIMKIHGTSTVLDILGSDDADVMPDVLTAIATADPTPPRPDPTPITPVAAGYEVDSGDPDSGWFDAGKLPDAPPAQETKRSYIVYVSVSSEELFDDCLRSLSMNPARGVKVPGQRFATIDGDPLVPFYLQYLPEDVSHLRGADASGEEE